MKKLLLFLLLAFSICEAQTWKELGDSTNFYLEKQDLQTALNWAKLALTQAEKEFGRNDLHYFSSLNLLGELFYYSGQIDSAIYHQEQCIKLSSSIKIEDPDYMPTILNNLGMYYKAERRFSDAEPLFKESLKLRRNSLTGDNPDLAMAINNLGYFYSSIGRLDDAEPLYKEALDMYRRIYKDDNPDLARSIINMATLCYIKERLSEAGAFFKEALEMYRRIYKRDHPDLANSINSMAILKYRQENYSEAAPLYKEALEMFKRLFKGDHPTLLMSIQNTASFYLNMGYFEEAELLNQEALEMARRIYKSDHPDLAGSLNNLAAFYNNMGRFTDAGPLLNEALEMNRRLYKGDMPELATSINNMALNMEMQGSFAKAELLYHEALEMQRRIYNNDNEALAATIHNVAQFYDRRGRFDQAESFYKESLSMFKRLYKEDNYRVAMSLNGLAVFLAGRGRYAEAETYCREAFEIVKRLYKNDNPFIIAFITNLANNLDIQGKSDEAELLFKQALEISRRLYKTDHIFLAKAIDGYANFYMCHGNYRLAGPLLNEAIVIKRRLLNENHPDLASSISNLARYYNVTENITKAESLYLELMKVSFNMMNNYFSSLSEKEKEQYFATFSQYYIEFNNFAASRYHLSPGLIEIMFDNQLLTKAMLLISSNKIRTSIMSSNNIALQKLFHRWKDLNEFRSKLFILSNQELYKKGINLDSLNKLSNELEKELSKSSEVFKREFDKKIFKWQDIKNSVGKDQAAVELFRFRYYDKKLTDSIYYAVLIIRDTSNLPDLVLLKNGNNLEGKFIELYRKQIDKQRKAVHDPEALSAALKELYKQFWAPIQEKLQGIKTVYLSVDGVYNQINLNTLINPASNKYLLDEIDLRLVTSTRDLVEGNPLNPTLKKVEISNTVELFGDPQFDLDSIKYLQLASNFRSGITREYYYLGNALDSTTRGGIIPLPGTRKEIENIANSFKERNWTVNKHLGAEALEEALKAVNNPGVLHIATHGKFLKDVERRDDERMMGFETQRFVENPLLKSMLLFSGAENTILGQTSSSAQSVSAQTEDGLLTAYEAQNLNLDNTELVVLSACETGLGEIKNGEGVYGLQRAFQVAGAKSLIMSLWSVSDEATQQLMTSFYNKWLSGKTKREAFREAQQDLKQKYPGFYYWGGFVMLGE